MFCSTCGADSQSGNAYCKRCGEWLPHQKAGSRVAFGGETPQQNIFTGLFMSALSTVAALVSAIALYATYLGSGQAKWSVYLAAAFCVCIAGWQASSFWATWKLRQRLNRGRDISPTVSELAGQEVRVLQAGHADSFVATPSVTENTTRILNAQESRHQRG